jgi:hypothetical protein
MRKRAKLCNTNSTTSILPNLGCPSISSTSNCDARIGFQVVKGVISQDYLEERALVISDGWPSWTFALDGLGFKSISTIAAFKSISSRDEFRSTSMANTLIDRTYLHTWINNNHSKGVLFIQGARSFLETIFKEVEKFDDLKLIYCCNDPTFWSCDGWRESHADAGGVTNGAWTFYSQNTTLADFDLPRIQRSLRHVLKTTEGESSSSQLKRACHPPQTLDSRILWNDKIPRVLTHSVFTKDRLVERLVTDEEMLDCYDLELSVQSELKRFWKSTGVRPTRSYVEQIPVKVLRSVALRVVKGCVETHQSLSPSDTNISDSDYDSDITMVTSNGTGQCRVAQNFDPASTDDDSIAAELHDDVTHFIHSDTQSSSSDKAAKDDDAEAVAEDWDIWTVSNFESSAGGPPIVCTGKYNKALHQPFFDGLRKLMLRRYRRNVTTSFLRYLRLEYPGMKKMSLSVGRTSKINTSSRGGNVSLDDSSSSVCYSVGAWVVQQRQAPRANPKKRRKLRQSSELQKDLDIGRDAVGRAANATWWNWDAGSTLFFWRWPKWSKSSVRDGIKLFVDWERMPSFWQRQQWPADELSSAKLKKKLTNVRNKKYVQPGFVKSLTSYFAVPKAKTDIRVVYDATACGLNDALWAPNFFLPTVDSILRNASSSTWFGDIDLGEMFLNYPLDENIRPFAGVDVTNANPGEASERNLKRIIERWARCLMGFKPSPFVTTQTFGWSEEVIVGDRSEPSNPFFWDCVKLNLPGTKAYDPSMPWVYRWNSRDSQMASFFGTYIDDIRGGGASEIACRQTIHRTASRINYLGQQDAPRKRGQATQSPRAWAGSKCKAIEGEGLYVLSMEGKWAKAKSIIAKFYSLVVVEKQSLLDYKMLESDVGFLCHVSRTYPIIFPYLKGFYNTMNNWRCDRDADGWKLSHTAWMELLAGDVGFETEADIGLDFEDRKRKFVKSRHSNHPASVAFVPRLSRDLCALSALFSPPEPTLRLIRGHSIQFALFGFGDASGGGFGSSWETKDGISYRFGTWGEDMDGESSNLRELTNLVDTLDEIGAQGSLKGVEVFLFTDNSTSEAAYYNGSSKSEKLFDLVLRVKKLEMHHQAKIHIIHVSGERMKDQGSDGLSRGNLNVGVMAGKRMLDFVPIHLTALERCSKLKPWLDTFVGAAAEYLDPEGWYTRGHDLDEDNWEWNSDGLKLPTFRKGTFIWSPQPCAAETAVEELRRARHKRQKSKHLFIVPRLMSPTWRKHLHKAADLILTLKPGHPAWPDDMLEPLTLAFVFPFIRHKPWQLRGSYQLLALGRALSEVWSSDDGREGPLLRQLWGYQEQLENMPAKLASKLLQSQSVDGFSYCKAGKRRGLKMEEEARGAKVFKRKKR